MGRPQKTLISIMASALIALIAIIPYTAVPMSPSFAASGITLNSSVQTSFPASMTFEVKARSDAAILKLRLHYIVDRQNYASVISEGWPQFNQATQVDTRWLWDMRKSSLPVGTRVEYWWTAEDASGKTSETSRSTVSFDDSRFTWQSLETSPVRLMWYNGSRTFADTLMIAAQQGLQRIENNTGAIPHGSVHVFIYASPQDLQSAELFPQQWEGGVTFEGFNVIAIAVPTSQLAFGERAVPHELTHWIVGQITFNNYGAGLPVWLDEGLATYGEGNLSSTYQSALDYAIRNNQLLSLRSLSSPFSAIAEQAYISYGESNSVVTFLIQKYGKDKMIQLLNTFHRGAGYDEALNQVYGFDQDGLDTIWLKSLGITASFARPEEPVLAAGRP